MKSDRDKNSLNSEIHVRKQQVEVSSEIEAYLYDKQQRKENNCLIPQLHILSASEIKEHMNILNLRIFYGK